MSTNQSIVPIDLTQELSSDDNEASEINEKVRNAISLNAWHTLLQTSCRFITGVLADVSAGRTLLNIKNPYKRLFLRSTQDIKNLEPIQPSVIDQVIITTQGRWIPRFKFENRWEGAPALSEEEKINILEQQLTLILHAARCDKRQSETMNVGDFSTVWPKCYNDVPYCHMMRSIFQHIKNCRIPPETCGFGFCEPAKRIISHFKNCPGRRCPLCSRVAFLVPAKPRVRRNAVDFEDEDAAAYFKRLARTRTQPPPPSSQPSSSSAAAPSNLFAFPTYSGFRFIPNINQAIERIDDDVPIGEPIVTLNDNETL